MVELKALLKKIVKKNLGFNYKDYWEDRYSVGGTSGAGSYGILAEYKANVVNEYLEQWNINSVIEFGCGDGNQLKFMNYPKYLGLDIANSAIDKCGSIFKDDMNKSFLLYHPRHFLNKGFFCADLVVCMDVLYHITDEKDLLKTLQDIFSCSSRHVILYTNIVELKTEPNSHIKCWDTLQYLKKGFPNFKIEEIVEQRYKELSGASFIFLRKKVRST